MAKEERFDFSKAEEQFKEAGAEPPAGEKPDADVEKPTVARLREVLADATERVVGEKINHFKTKYVLETVGGDGLIINVAMPRQYPFGRKATRHPQYKIELFERNRQFVERDHTILIIGDKLTYTREERLTSAVADEVQPFVYTNTRTTYPGDSEELRGVLISHVRQATPPLSSSNWG